MPDRSLDGVVVVRVLLGDRAICTRVFTRACAGDGGLLAVFEAAQTERLVLFAKRSDTQE